jgi:hypothetical protein
MMRGFPSIKVRLGWVVLTVEVVEEEEEEVEGEHHQLKVLVPVAMCLASAAGTMTERLEGLLLRQHLQRDRKTWYI